LAKWERYQQGSHKAAGAWRGRRLVMIMEAAQPARHLQDFHQSKLMTKAHARRGDHVCLSHDRNAPCSRDQGTLKLPSYTHANCERQSCLVLLLTRPHFTSCFMCTCMYTTPSYNMPSGMSTRNSSRGTRTFATTWLWFCCASQDLLLSSDCARAQMPTITYAYRWVLLTSLHGITTALRIA
jgi:hypothetical protein